MIVDPLRPDDTDTEPEPAKPIGGIATALGCGLCIGVLFLVVAILGGHLLDGLLAASSSTLNPMMVVGSGSSGAPRGQAIAGYALGFASEPATARYPSGAPPTVAHAARQDLRVVVSGSALSDVTRSGYLSWMPERFGRDYLALPIGPGHVVRLCAAAGCRVMRSTDAGPDLAMQRAGRVADVGVETWEELCGLPRRFGLCEGSWTVVSLPAAPATDWRAP